LPEPAGRPADPLRLPARPESLALVIEYVRKNLEACGAPRESRLRIELAVEETASNIIAYAYSPAGSGDLECGFATDGKTAEITLTDWGAAFNPLEKDDPDLSSGLEGRKPGGLGIYLARNLAGSCSYRRDGDRNILAISMRIAPAAGRTRSKEDGHE